MTHATESAPRRMRRLLEQPGIVVSPGVYDGYSIRLVERLGFTTASTSGAGLANSRLGEPDVGILSMLENVDACRALAAAVSIPLMADADTGYGNALSVYFTVRHFERAGVAGINIEDQVAPKRCGHMSGKQVVPVAAMCEKVAAAVDAREDTDFIICARTDAIDVEGIDAAVHRARAYAEAGADLVFPDAVRSREDIARFVTEVNAPISINMGFGIRSRPTTPLLTMRELEAIGVKRVSLPRMLPAAAIHGMRMALELMRGSMETGDTVDRPDILASIQDIADLMGYDDLADLEDRLLGAGTGPRTWIRES